MKEVTLSKRNKKAEIIISIGMIIISTSAFILFYNVEVGLRNLIMLLPVFVIGFFIKKDPKEGCFFRYDNTKVEYRFPYMESQKEINIQGIHSVKEEWYGLSFINSENQIIEFSTNGLNKKENRQIVNVFMNIA